jgi:predicted Zn-dependent protease
MRLSRLLLVCLLPLLIQSCSEVPLPAKVSVREQLVVDTMKAKGLVAEFDKQARFDRQPAIEKYLQSVAQQIVLADEDLREETVMIRVHQDLKREWTRTFAFPGVMISLPKSFLSQVNFENELAALIALQLALVENRELAKSLEKQGQRPILGQGSIFNFSKTAMATSIETGTRMMYAAGYDPRGMVTLIQKHPGIFVEPDSASSKKDIDELIKQAQKTKNEFMPSLQPIVRSNEFLKMKKDLKGSS